MRVRAYRAHPSIRDHWPLRCMSISPDQVVSLKRDPECLSPSKLDTHLSTHCSRDKRLSGLCPARRLGVAVGLSLVFCTQGCRFDPGPSRWIFMMQKIDSGPGRMIIRHIHIVRAQVPPSREETGRQNDMR
ncbi:UNVERIFIED_CONTAM: hypothetical protein NCL1_08099 [Trichonephila clavipes]